jgi:hypothetical protein
MWFYWTTVPRRPMPLVPHGPSNDSCSKRPQSIHSSNNDTSHTMHRRGHLRCHLYHNRIVKEQRARRPFRAAFPYAIAPLRLASPVLY